MVVTEGTVDVVFDMKPGSRRWKDCMVFLARDLESSLPGLVLQCFFDLVAGTPHLASLHQWRSGSETCVGR
jgi:hypothetical protein